MSITIGLNANHADSSACLFENNKLIFAIEEERINRIKHWSGLPIESILSCIEHAGIKISDIKNFKINTNNKSNLNEKIFFFLRNFLFGKKKFEILERLSLKLSLKKEIEDQIKVKFNNCVKFNYIDHHLSHLSSAYYASNFDKAIGLTIDGFGDFSSLNIAKCFGGSIKVTEKVFFPNSIGLLYEAFTQFIGFLNYGEEYKMMGLSSYGEPEYFDKIKKELFFDYKNYILNTNYFNHINKNYKYNFKGNPNQEIIFNKKIYELFSNQEINSKKFKENIASSIQKIFEDILLFTINRIKKINFSNNLVYAGGCALNSLANKKIFDSNLFDKIYIPYSPGDGGGSIGSALYFLSNNNYKNFQNINTPYIGPDYTNEIIGKEIKDNSELKNFKIKFYNNKNELNTQISRLIKENNVIGLFNGKMEFGARALGNRSIIANPCNPNIKEIINLKIKRRENFRPFAPAILIEEKEAWFNNKITNPYMAHVESINLNKRELIPAVCHIDGTGRVQTVSKTLNYNFYDIIYKFYQLTGVPLILNTSFNENEPIVMKPSDAIECFLRTKMDVIVLENYMIIRSENFNIF